MRHEASAAALVTLAGSVASAIPNFLARAFRLSSSEASAGRSVSVASVIGGSAAAGFSDAAAIGAPASAAAPSAEAALHTMGFLACRNVKVKDLVGCRIPKIR